MSEPVILFVKPGAVKPGDKGRLFKAGVVVVEVDDPLAVKLVTPSRELEHGSILAAAALAINNNSMSEYSQRAFGKAMAAAILAQADAVFGK